MAFDASKFVEPYADDQLVRDLMAARARVDSPEKWTQFTREDTRGRLCIIGATCAAVTGSAWSTGDTPTADLLRVQSALEALGRETKPAPGVVVNCVSGFNDTHEHHDIMALFDRAIAQASHPASVGE